MRRLVFSGSVRPLRRLVAGAGAAIVLAPALFAGTSPAEPARGVFLVAEPHLPDPRFHRSVVLLIDHDRTGSLGLILNKPTGATLAEAVPELDASGAADRTVFFGGPVGIDGLTFLVRKPPDLESAKRILEDVFWAGEADALREMLAAGKSDSELRVYAGYSGWGPGQLEAEIARGDWRLVTGKAASVFPKTSEGLWEEMIGAPPAGGIRIHAPGRSPGARAIGS